MVERHYRHNPWFWPMIAFGLLMAVVVAGTIISLVLVPAVEWR